MRNEKLNEIVMMQRERARARERERERENICDFER